VFNTEYTRAAYPELANAPYRIIPIGTDESTFTRSAAAAGIPHGSVLWIGSGNPIKGFNLARRLAAESTRPWIFVMKDETPVPESFMTLRRIDHHRLVEVASACSVGVCTSAQETQHLAGIEMGMCGLPLVTTDVGVYHGREPGVWGRINTGDWHQDIEDVAESDPAICALYWRRMGFGVSACMARWSEAVHSLETEHVLR